MSLKYKMLLIALVAMSPLWGFGNQKYSSSKHHTEDLAAQVESQLSTAAPNAIVVVVDRATRTAYVTGATSNQADVDQVKQALKQMTGIRVMSTGSISPTDRTSETYGTSRTNATSRIMDASATPTVDSMNPPMNRGDSDMRTNYNNPQSNSSNYGSSNTSDLNTNANNTDTDARDIGTAGTAGGSATGPKTGSATNGTAVSDASLTQSVKDALNKEGLMGQNKIVVETQNGLVTLTGTALSETQAARIVELAHEVPGVHDVNVNIQLQDEKRPYTRKPGPQI